MKKLIIPAIAIILAFSASAFTAKRSTSSFYIYTSSSFAQRDIQNIANYAASDGTCSGATDVCGVQLTTAHSLGSEPVSSEFTPEEADLWSSQQNGSPADTKIQMQN